MKDDMNDNIELELHDDMNDNSPFAPADDMNDYKIIEHPAEDIFDIEPGTTQVPATVPPRQTELVLHEEFDKKDQEIEENFQEVYDYAIEAFEQQTADSEVIEPKYRARNQEVAVQFLNAALSAAKEKSNLKIHKDKLSVTKVKTQGPQTVNNNLVVADRNELMKTLMGKNNEKK